jgi:hypothetical protein
MCFLVEIDFTGNGVYQYIVRKREGFRKREGAPPEVALSRAAFAVHVIEECRRASGQLGELAESILVANTQPGPFNRVPGQPSPKYSSLRERSEATCGDLPAGSTARRLFARIRDAANRKTESRAT